MTTWFRPRSLSPALLAVLGVMITSGRAGAQVDLNPPLPNVLLLVDTSGSMEAKTDGSSVTCNPGNTAGVNDKSRWIDLVEVMTGTIQNYTCQEISRLDPTVGFKTGEYALGGEAYDFRYPIPYHRPLSGSCAPAPGVQSANPFIYPTVGGISYHAYNGSAPCTFAQPSNDGLLDTYQELARFGLMTFDTSTDAGTGYDGLMASATANTTTGKAGLWSYFVGSAATGMPSGCQTGTKPQEVGARNAAAPPWEGRMVNFGNPYDGVRDYIKKNAHIQEVLLATRPYGATPIAGMLHDAEDFFLNDKTKDPDRNPASLSDTETASDFGPWEDPYGACRQQIEILLTDGQPNMDLRPFCKDNSETPMGVCPFDLPEDTTKRLFSGTGHRPITTYVVGFALDKVDDDGNPATAPLDCNDITATDVDTTSTTNLCNKPSSASNLPLQACCTLKRIALAGGGKAFFAANRETLRSQISDILSNLQSASSRTAPVTTAGGSGTVGFSLPNLDPTLGATVNNNTFRFTAGFQVGRKEAWQGTLQRNRFVCKDVSSVLTGSKLDPEPLKGDDFVRNVAKGGPDARRVYSIVGGSTSSDPISELETIRPNIGTTDLDGIGTYSGRPRSGTSATFISNLEASALAIPAASCIDQNNAPLATPNQCRDQYLKWWLGYDNGQSTVTSRCPTVGAASCQLVGDIIHSAPILIDHPSAPIRDESYARFQLVQAKRPMVLYASSNDGLVHAFQSNTNDPAEFGDATKMILNDSKSNELWAFAPPAVLPNLYHLYPYNHQLLLDGTPAWQDVVAVQPAQSDQIPTVFERTAAAAQSGGATWRTVIVQGFGTSHPGYFALDVTNPVPSSAAPDDTTKGGPRFLWQLTRDKHGGNLFGRGGGTPAITTLYMDPAGAGNPREIPVAVLPGGPGGTAATQGPGCPAAGRSYGDLPLDPDYPPRARVHCYQFSNDEEGARSLTIVRLDTGELVRTFRLSKDNVSSEIQPRTTEADIDAPITGQPVAFPGFVGQVADRIFVGDAEGRVFKVDVSSSDPGNWTMKLFQDLYPASFKGATGAGFDGGQPIVLPPVVSVDGQLNVVLDVATGDQDSLLGAKGSTNYLFSLKDKVNDTATGTQTVVNWFQRYDDGEHVVGTMGLFNRGLYFATYKPPIEDDGSLCMGMSSIRSVDYLESVDPKDSSTGPAKATVIASGISAVTPGVELVQDPTCSASDSNTGDPVLGFGAQAALKNVNVGKFKVVYSTGSLNGNTNNQQVGQGEVTLPNPPTLSAIQSWASIVE